MLIPIVAAVAAVVVIVLLTSMFLRTAGPRDEIEHFQKVREMTTRWSEEHAAAVRVSYPGEQRTSADDVQSDTPAR